MSKSKLPTRKVYLAKGTLGKAEEYLIQIVEDAQVLVSKGLLKEAEVRLDDLRQLRDQLNQLGQKAQDLSAGLSSICKSSRNIQELVGRSQPDTESAE